MDLIDLADATAHNNFTRLTDHRKTRHDVRHAKNTARALRQFDQGIRLCEVIGQWLVTKHINASVQKRLSRGEMHVVRSRDHHRVHTIGARGFFFSHLRKRSIAPLLGQVPIRSSGFGAHRVG